MPEWTKDQLDAITVRGGTVLVSAAAGSGKTAVLVERIIRRLTDREHPVDADRFLVVTFTRAAAFGMRQKIQESLKALLRNSPQDLLLQRQLSLVDKAKICTIDSFFSGVVRENFDVLGVSPNLRIVDDAFLAAKSEEILDGLLERRYRHPDKSFLALVRYFGEENDKRLRSEIRELYQKLRSIPNHQKWLEKQLSLYGEESAESSPWVETLYHKGSALIDAAFQASRMAYDTALLDEAVFKGYQKALEADLKNASLAKEMARPDLDVMRDIFHRVLVYANIGRAGKGADPDVKERTVSWRKAAKDAAEKGRKLFDLTVLQAKEELLAQRPLAEALFDLVTEYENCLWEDKRAESYADFDDFAEMTYSLLVDDEGNPTKRAEEIAGSYDEILIDEYQDTNFLQDSIFRAISRKGENLFFVGDLKQSIYQFRNAAPRVFSEKKDRYSRRETGNFPALIPLSKNFRSRDGVISGINFFFEKLMSRQLGDVDYGQEDRLYWGASYYPPNGDAFGVEAGVLDLASLEGEEKAVLLEASAVAQKISSMISEGYPVTDGAALRPCTPGDFVILLRSSREIDRVYAEALKSAGVEASTGSSAGYFDSREVSVMINLLRVVDNPVSDIPMAAVLLSPMSVFDCDDLARLTLGYPADSLYGALLKEEQKGSQKAGEFLSFLRNLRQKSAVYGIRRLIQYIYDATDFIEVMAGLSKNGLREANLKLLLKYAGDYEASGSRELRPFLSYLDKLMELGRDLEVANPQTESKAVSIMTIHHSKGLEFPIVFLANCGKRFNKMDLRRTTAVDMFCGYGMKYIDRDRLLNYDSLPLKGIRLVQEQALVSEEMRLLYVAMTRAKEKLCLFITEKDLGNKLRAADRAICGGAVMKRAFLENASSYSDWLLAALMDSDAMDSFREKYGLSPSPGGKSPVGVFSCSLTQEEQKPVLPQGKAYKAIMEEISGNLAFSYPYWEDTLIPIKLSVTEITHKTEALSLSAPRFAGETGFTAAQKGSIFHRCMQFADFSRGRSRRKRNCSGCLPVGI